MSSYLLTKKAVQDLKHIWNYAVDNWPEKQADKYYQEILNHCSRLSNNPKHGKQYDKLWNGLKGSNIYKTHNLL